MVSVLLIFQVLGLLSSVSAILEARTPQGAVAWVIGLNAISIFAVPAYWLFGHNKFHGYVQAHRNSEIDIKSHFDKAKQAVSPYSVEDNKEFPAYEAIKSLAELPFLNGNEIDLLIDGEATFESLYQGITEAKSYVLFQFYIIRSDVIGESFKSLLIDKSKQGVDVFVLYDEFGSSQLANTWIQDLKKHGVSILPFNTRDSMKNPFQVNFRNHRKIVVVDGETTWIGGLNIGDDYLGKDAKLTPWRDTHLCIKGPSTLKAQYSFLNDWYWASKSLLSDLNWSPKPASTDNKKVMLIASGPADPYETSSLFFTQAINSATNRLWIATPYFIPDMATMTALRLAILKKVDVRIITPKMNDNWFIKKAAKVYLSQLTQMGARIYSYQEGFLHQKVMLIDNKAAVVGTVNFDNRSFRLNFEVSAAVADEQFAEEIKQMLVDDIKSSKEITGYNLSDEPLIERLKAHASSLMSPLL